MAKREISGTLRNLKFMQRAVLKNERKKIDDEEEKIGNLQSLTSVRKKCVVITDGDPQPGAVVGRMSFQSFNPSIEKLNEEALNGQRTDGSPSSCSSREGKMSLVKLHLVPMNWSVRRSEPSREANGYMKRKQSEVVSGQHNPNKFRRNGKGLAFKDQKGKKVDWSVLKPSKPVK